ncbi:MAG: hypothetical protein II999_06830 [Bacteroidaceae bacterium]|nr:hypothetical protein [Bacteroidaceae bacterium]
MNTTIDPNEIPGGFATCYVSDCPLAETCLRHLAYDMVEGKYPFMTVLSPKWKARQKGPCQYYLKNERVRRARGFIRTLNAISAGKTTTFRIGIMSHMGARRYYQARKGEILLKPTEEQLVIRLANQCGVVLDEYFDSHEELLLWNNE